METIIRKGTFLLLFLVACSTVNPIRSDCKRTLKEERREIKVEEARNNAAEDLLLSAERWINIRELTGNNDHPMITKAMELCGLSGNRGYAWCAASQAEIHDYAGLIAPHSARVMDWFSQNIVWIVEFGELPLFDKRGMVGGLYYSNLGRLGHIVLIVGEDKNNYYTLEGNTNIAGSREGDGFYKKIRDKEHVVALADYCLIGNMFIKKYDDYLQSKLK